MLQKVQVMGLIALASIFAPASLFAQRATRRPPPGIAGCYKLALGEWSRPLGVNAGYHAIPGVVRLDSARAIRGGGEPCRTLPIPLPTGLRGTRVAAPRDTVEIMCQWVFIDYGH